MAFTEFVCRSGGSNMNGGALSSNAEPAVTPVYSFTNGGWNSTTGVYTPTSGNPSLTAAVGDYANVFIDGATTPSFIGRVTAVSSSTLTVSTSAKGGTAPTTAGTGISINVGGAWAGPSGSVAFPWTFATGAMVNAAGDHMRVNLKNDQTHSITATITHALVGPVTFQGYGTTFGDYGKTTIDGGTTGASYVLLTLSVNGVDRTRLVDLIFQNNGATGNAAGISGLGDPRTTVNRVVVNSIRGDGYSGAGRLNDCEAYACNQSNTANFAGFNLANGAVIRRCIAHDNVGSNGNGFYSQGTSPTLIECIADSNGSHGMSFNNITNFTVVKCDLYNNAGDGIRHITATTVANIESSNFVGNGGFGINLPATATGNMWNNGFGDNVSGATQNTSRMAESDTVTYGTGTTPWIDPANGDFRIDPTSLAKGAGRSSFTQTASGYAGTTGYPDIGAAQHQDAGGGSAGLLVNPGMSGGMV